MGIVRFALRYPHTFYVMALAILFLGISAAITSPKDIFPRIDIPVVTVIWQYSNLTPREMDQRVTTYSEYSISSNVNDIRNMSSQTLEGISVTKIFFQPNVNIDLAIAQIDVHIGLEEDLGDGDALQRLGRHVADVVDVRADGVLAIGRDALIHLPRRQVRVLPDDRDDGDVDAREDVLRRGEGRADPEEEDGKRHHIEGVRIAQRETDDAHGSILSARVPVQA